MGKLADLIDAKVSEIGDVIYSHRLWYLQPENGDEILAILDTADSVVYAGLASFSDVLRSNRYLFLYDKCGKQLNILFDTMTKLLWFLGLSVTNGKEYYHSDAEEILREADWGGLSGWKLPSLSEVQYLADSDNQFYNADSKTLGRFHSWLIEDRRRYDFSNCSNSGASANWGLIPVNSVWHDMSEIDIYAHILLSGIRLGTREGVAVFPFVKKKIERSLLQEFIFILHERKMKLISNDGGSSLVVKDSPVLQVLKDIDYRMCRLPRLEASQISDPNKGLWELWGESEEELKSFHAVARDPARDVKHFPVAIDFGTSSTVVALFDGIQSTLLRIGARDFYAPINPIEFQNPTVVELLDYDSFAAEWFKTAYRPDHDWNWLRIGHEAQASWRDNPGDTSVLASIMPRLKTWAMRSEGQAPIRLTDRAKGKEISIPHLSLRQIVKGEPITVGDQDPFDPIEFYAFQLGLAINWRGRGIFYEYYMSFPAKYDKATKDKIKSSFARGLCRSLPPTLIRSFPSILQEFRVSELASEPAAYAASALPYLGIAPVPEGIRYAVFDFGGGTTDFDFGLWRTATAEEADVDGFETVFEHLESSGDNYLGGEQLLEHLAYRIFCGNLSELRSKRIHFTRPEDAAVVPGSEVFLQPTQAAQTNTIILISKIRSFWENDDDQLDSQIKVDLLDANGIKQPVELSVDGESLQEFITARIQAGVDLFLSELVRTFGQDGERNDPIHVLLAGNASRSRFVRDAFDTTSERWRNALDRAGANLDVVIHAPLPIDPEKPYAPTAKTGVALGLLALVPGAGVKVIDRVCATNTDEAPFQYFFGRMKGETFQYVLSPESIYGEWMEVGPIPEGGVVNCYATKSRRAWSGMSKGDPELRMIRLSYLEARRGSKLWAKAVGPDKIEVGPVDPGEVPGESMITKVLDLSSF